MQLVLGDGIAAELLQLIRCGSILRLQVHCAGPVRSAASNRSCSRQRSMRLFDQLVLQLLEGRQFGLGGNGL